MKKLITLSLVAFLASCADAQTSTVTTPSVQASSEADVSKTSMSGTDTAIFAGGCFWCIESDFEKLPGVIEAVSGYSGGRTNNPNYKQVSYTETGHYEVVEVTYKPDEVSYNELLDYFWTHIDPTDPNGQFCDKGSSYRTAIFVRPDQIDAATASKANIIETKPFKADIVTPVLPAAKFYKAETYHQDYYKKNPAHYNRYRKGCGRDRTVARLWGKK